VSTVTNAVDTNGIPIGIKVAIAQPFVGIQTGGVVASNLYPVTAQPDTLYVGGSGNPQTAQLLLSGLNPAETYNFTFFASRNATDDRTSTYTINGETVSLQAAENTNKTVALTNVAPNSAGQVTVTVGHGASATYGYLGVMSITTTGASPPLQLNISVTGSLLNLSWPQSATNCVLEMATSLAPGAIWTTVSNSVGLADGQFTVPLTVTSPQKFFRLRRNQ